MTRVKRGKVTGKRRKRYLKLAASYKGLNSTSSTLAMEQVIQSLNYKYIGRKLKKRNFKRLWVNSISIRIKKHNTAYCIFSKRLKKNYIYMNNKLLAHTNSTFVNVISRIIF